MSPVTHLQHLGLLELTHGLLAGFDVPPPGGVIPGFGLPPGMPGAEAAAAAVPAAAASPVATGFSSGFSNGPAPPMIGMQIPGAVPSPSLKAATLPF